MKISKQCLLIMGFSLGLASSFNTYTYYNASDLKLELASIAQFTESPRNHTVNSSEKVIEWLNKKMSDEYESTNTEMLKIARIIQSNATTDAKTSLLLEMITEEMVSKAKLEEEQKAQEKTREEEYKKRQKKERAKNKKRNRRESVKALGFVSFVIIPTAIMSIKLTEDFAYPALCNWLNLKTPRLSSVPTAAEQQKDASI